MMRQTELQIDIQSYQSIDINQTHPLDHIEYFIASEPEIKQVEMSLYTYHPLTVQDERIIKRVDASKLRTSFYNFSKSIEPFQEIAFHSTVYVCLEGQEMQMHIPMIDFKSSSESTVKEVVTTLKEEYNCENAIIVHSGRSFHAYILKLLTFQKWTEFMGRILLFNVPEKEEIVDMRWVGHRLFAGYGALRWTKNTKQYLSEPRVSTGTIRGSYHRYSRPMVINNQNRKK